MFRKRETDVLVVGAGPVGLTTALALAGRGIETKIVDGEWRPAAHSYALALHPSTLELLDGLGITNELVPAGRRLDRVEVHRGGDAPEILEYGGLDTKYPFLLVLPQSSFETVLEAALARSGVKVHWNHSVSAIEEKGYRVLSTVDRLQKISTGYAAARTEWAVDKTATVESKILVGADGHRSRVRKSLGIDFESMGDTEMYAVFEFETDFDAGSAVRIDVTGDRADVLWPLPGGACRFSFLMPPGTPGEPEREKSRVSIGRRTFPHLSAESLDALIEERAPWFTGTVTELRWSLGVRFERRMASSFGRRNCWLVGDAGHVTSPIGMQSMNVGIREALDLAEGIDAVLGGALELSGYEEARLAEWRDLHGLEGPGEGDSLRPRIPASGEHLDALLSGGGGG
jgi:2-polyprenyl-6-methoxyphenol hydroxylase-like FAD-dependent oxidoreductase